MAREDREFRRLERMKKDREKEEKRKNQSSFVKNATTVAAGVGIAYVAIQNKDVLLDKISDTIGKAAVTVNRNSTGMTSFKGKIDEAKDLNKALQDTYGEASPKNVLNALANRKEKYEAFTDNLRFLNKERLGRGLKSTVPKDIARTQDALIDSSFNRYKATQEAAQVKLKEVLQKDKYAEAFGDNLDNVERVLRENPKLLINDQTKGIKRKDSQFDQMPKSILNAFVENNQQIDRTVDFNVEGAEKQAAFVEKMFEASQEVYESIQKQRVEIRTGRPGKDNYLSAYNQLFDYTTMQGIREGHQPKQSLFNASMEKQGFRNITMGEAKDLYVSQEEGLLRAVSKDSEQAKNIQELFTPEVKTKDTKGLADRYVEKAVKAGFSVDDVSKDIFSHNIFLNEVTGEVLNTTTPGAFMDEVLDYAQENYQVPIIRVNPIDLTKRSYNKQQGLTPSSAVYQSGEIHPFLAKGRLSVEQDLNVRNINSVGQTDRPYLHIGETIYDASIVSEILGENKDVAKNILDNQLPNYAVLEGYETMNIGQGVGRRMAEVHSGRTNRELQERNLFQRIWGTGQEAESNWEKAQRWYEGFESPTGTENILESHLQSTLLGEKDSGEILEVIQDTLGARGKPLSLEGQDALHEELLKNVTKELPAFLSEDITPANLKTDEGIFNLAEEIVNANKGKQWTIADTIEEQMVQNMEEQIQKTVFHNRENPDRFLKKKHYIRGNGAVGDVIQDALGESEIQTQTGAEKLRQLIEGYGVTIADRDGQTENLVNAINTSGVMDKSGVLGELSYLRADAIADFFGKKSKETETVQDLIRIQADFQGYLLKNEGLFKNGMQEALNIAEPWNTAGVTAWEEPLLKGTRTTPIKKVPTIRERMEGLQGQPKTVGEAARDVAEQVAQRGIDFAKDGFNVAKPLDGEMTAGHVFPWRVADNLDRRLQDLGLGLPNYLKETPVSTIANQFGRRIVLPYAMFQQAKWFDDMVLGGSGSKKLAQTYANMHLDAQGFKENRGFNQIGRNLQDVMPWSEQMDEWLPNKAFNAATFGLLSDFRTPDELRNYYESGEDPVRSGRYWGVGSSGAWMGGRIDHYTSNWYRKTMSDWEYTEDMYGSRREYWANNWMPTLSHPLAPLKHFVTDPYHWEDKHALSRPYAATGGFSELQMIPLVGPSVDRVVSGVLKPEIKNPRLEKAHEEYMLQYSGALAENYINLNTGGVMSSAPGGGTTLSSQLYQVSPFDEDGYLDEEKLTADAIRFDTENLRMAQNLEKGPARGTAQEIEEAALAQTNRQITASKRPVREPKPSAIGRFTDPTLPQTLDEVYNPNHIFSKHGTAEAALANLAQFSGLQGFIRKTLSGLDIDSQKTRYLQTSDEFQSYSRRFWDKNLGGLGGDLSEIGRRYISNSPQDNRYNPIRNEMPDWMNLTFSINFFNCWKIS